MAFPILTQLIVVPGHRRAAASYEAAYTRGGGRRLKVSSAVEVSDGQLDCKVGSDHAIEEGTKAGEIDEEKEDRTNGVTEEAETETETLSEELPGRETMEKSGA
eukprot:65271-Rhodomonas_salina.4